MSNGRRLELPEDLSVEEERAVLVALERYFRREDPHPHPWVLAGRMDATGWGAVQARRYAEAPWGTCSRAPFARPGVPSVAGRGDAS
jgi:hypothetical protein